VGCARANASPLLRRSGRTWTITWKKTNVITPTDHTRVGWRPTNIKVRSQGESKGWKAFGGHCGLRVLFNAV